MLIALVALYSLYLLSRLWLMQRAPIFWDEAFHAVQAQTGLDDPAQRFQFVADGKPPLFNWVSIGLVDLGLDPLTAVRTVSFLAGLVTLTVVMLLGRWLAGDWAALAAGTLYVLSPFALVHDTYGLVDGLFAACAMLALWLQVQLARRPTALTAIGAGAAVGAAILTRQIGYLGLVLLPVSLLAFHWSRARRGQRLLRWAGCAVLAVVVALALSAIQKLAPYDEIATPRQDRTIGEARRDPFANVDAVWPPFAETLTGYVGWAVLLLAVVAVVAGLAGRDARVVLPAAWALGPICLVFLLLQFGFPRYFFSAGPPILVLAGGGAVVLARAFARVLGGRTLLVARVVGAALVLAGPAVVATRILTDPEGPRYPSLDTFQYVAGWPAGTGLEDLKEIIERDAPAGTSVVAGVYFTPWNLAVQFDEPRRIPIGQVPYADGVRAQASGGRTIEFYPANAPQAANAQFVVQHGTFGVPPYVDLGRYRLVASFARPTAPAVGDDQPARETVLLYERVDLP